ncbi:MAG: phosphatase PAP2 family protein [Candidatus Dormibacteria bacterium]
MNFAARARRQFQAATSGHRSLMALFLACYLVIVLGLMIWRGVSITPERTLLILFLAALVVGRGVAFLRDWVPFLVVFLGWELMRGFAGHSSLPVHYGDVIAVERTLFAGTVPTVWLQQHFYNPSSVAVWDVVAMSLYFLHFPLPIAVGFVIWLSNRTIYIRFVSALMLMALVAFVTFLLLPVSPPWLSSLHGDLPVVHKITDETVTKLHQNIDLGPVYSFLYGFNPNKVAAFPSLHAAFPLLATLYAFRAFGRRAWPLIPYTAMVWVAIVYLGEHYVVDALGGAVFAVIAYLVVERLLAGRLTHESEVTPARSAS